MSSGSCIISQQNESFIVCEINQQPEIGNLTATITSRFLNSVFFTSIPTQIATLVPAPTINQNSSNLAINAEFLTIIGSGFDNSSLDATQVSLSFYNGISNPNCDIFSISSEEIICTNLNLKEKGNLLAIVNSFGGSSENTIISNIVGM